MRYPETKEQIFLVDCIISDLALYLVQDEGMSVNEALATIYDSE